MAWSNRYQNDQNNTKGFTEAQKKQIANLQRKVNSKQKIVDNLSKRATNKQGNGKTR